MLELIPHTFQVESCEGGSSGFVGASLIGF